MRARERRPSFLSTQEMPPMVIIIIIRTCCVYIFHRSIALHCIALACCVVSIMHSVCDYYYHPASSSQLPVELYWCDCITHCFFSSFVSFPPRPIPIKARARDHQSNSRYLSYSKIQVPSLIDLHSRALLKQ